MRGPQLLAPLGILVLAITFVLAESDLLDLSPLALGILTGLGAAGLAVALWQGRPPEERWYVSLGAVFCLYYAISYGFALLGNPPDFSDRIFPNGLDGVNLSPLPLGIIMWFVGYRLLHSQSLSRGVRRFVLPERTVSPRTGHAGGRSCTTVIARVLLIVSGAGYGYLRNAGEVTTSASPLLQYAAEYGGFGLVIMGLAVVASGHASDNRSGYRRAYLWMLPVELVLGVLVGQKSEFLIVVVMMAFALRAAGRLPTRRLILTAVASLLLIFPLVESYRDILRPESGRQLSAAEAPAALLTAVGQTGVAFTAGPGSTCSTPSTGRSVGSVRQTGQPYLSRPMTPACPTPPRARWLSAW